MSNSLSKDLGLIDGQTYIIGREGDTFIEGHIYIDSPTVSRQHAAIKIKNGRVYLRDLNSTNGTYLVESDSLLDFEEGYVNPHQPMVIGAVKCTIQGLLVANGVYSDSTRATSNFDNTTKPVISITGQFETGDPDNKPANWRS